MGGPGLEGRGRVSTASSLDALYRAMLEALGPSHWWPGDTPFEVAVGAILTQNTNWGNVEKAIANLKEADLLTPEALHQAPLETVQELIRPSGYFRMKAVKLKNFLALLHEAADLDMDRLAAYPMHELRPMLLSVNGVGPETADSILCYALEKPSFVVDAYTFRILGRHGLVDEEADYHGLRDLFMDNLPEDQALFNEYHALLVRVGHKWCKKKEPLCDQGCPLQPLLA